MGGITFSRVVDQAGRGFVAAAIILPNALFILAVFSGSIRLLFYTHVLTGGAWTGFDLFMGFVFGPSLAKVGPKERAEVFKRLTPKTSFLLPMVSGVAIGSGILLANRFMILSLSNFWVLVSLIITALLTIQGFGVLFPNGIRIYLEILSDKPDIEKIGRLGLRNARLGGVQGVLQLAIIYAMANLRM
jgi:hypothetical protein